MNSPALQVRETRNPLQFHFDKIWIDSGVENHPRTKIILERLTGIPFEIVEDTAELKKPFELGASKRQIVLTSHHGRAFKPCQGIGDAHICCNYYILDLISGCPMDCSYCILQHYLENNPITTIYVNIDEVLGEVAAFLDSNLEGVFRIGTGELSDSLALDRITGFSEQLIRFFSERKNAFLELKTKTDMVDHVLSLPHKGRTVISWSVNTARIIAHEERGTAPLEARLAAARRCAEAGYKVGFHFDPIIMTTGSNGEIAAYEATIDQIFAAVDPKSVAWISLGLFRYPLAMKSLAQRRFPATRIFSGELIPAGYKMRYPRFLRERYYRPLWERLARHISTEKIYFCMETDVIWKKFDSSVVCHASLERRLTQKR